MERGSTAEDARRRGVLRELRSTCALVIARLAGGLGLPCVLLSVGGQSFVAPFFTAPRGQCCVSSLDVAVGARWWAQAQVCGDAAVVVEGRRQSVYVLLLYRRPVPLVGTLRLGGWCSVSFSRDGPPRWGASRDTEARPPKKKKFCRLRSASCSHTFIGKITPGNQPFKKASHLPPGAASSLLPQASPLCA